MSVHLARPSDDELRRLLEDRCALDFSYPEVGTTRDPTRVLGRAIGVRYTLSHHRARLGHGADCFERACAALDRWSQFAVDGVELVGSEQPAEPGRCVGVGMTTLGLWSFHPCRVVYRETEARGPVHRHAYAYGTLPGHALRGEERFAVEHHPGNGTVWYDLLAFSRPAALAPRLGRPWLRRVQKRFAEGSARALERAVAAPSGLE